MDSLLLLIVLKCVCERSAGPYNVHNIFSSKIYVLRLFIKISFEFVREGSQVLSWEPVEVTAVRIMTEVYIHIKTVLAPYMLVEEPVVITVTSIPIPLY